MLIIRIAWRSLFRNKKRTIITTSAIAFGYALFIIFLGMGTGQHEQMINDGIKMGNGHIVIEAKGYNDKKANDLYIKNPDEILKIVNNLNYNLKSFKRIILSGLISSATNSFGMSLVGIDPDKEKNLTPLIKKIEKGNFLQNKNNEIIIGYKLAKNLKVEVSDKIVVMAQGFGSDINSALFRISGIFKTNSPTFDKYLGFTNLNEATNLSGFNGGATNISIFLDKDVFTNQVTSELKNKITNPDIEILPWYEALRELYQYVELDDASLYAFMAIIFIIVILGILNTMYMSIFERIREFGVMSSIGTSPRKIMSIVLLESFFIALLGLIVGTLIGGAVNYYFEVYGLDLRGLTKENIEVTGVMVDMMIYSKLHALDVLKTAFYIMVITLGISLFPAIRAARLNPVDAMKHV